MRYQRIAILIITLALFTAASPAANGQVGGTFVPTGDMRTARWQHTATLLTDGRVLIAGGEGGLSSTELYDPASGTFQSAGGMSARRRLHTATLLPDGKVLIAGGWGESSAELYDPATGRFVRTGDMLEDQAGHTAVLLRNGKVLTSGGMRAARPWPTAARAELYDPLTGTFVFAGTHATNGSLYPGSGGPVWPVANVLPDGRVLITGDNPPEIYDPIGDTFDLTGALTHSSYRYGMYWHRGTSLTDGKVLITGGIDDWACSGFVNAEIYDPSSSSFIALGNMTEPRELHTSTLLRDGSVLLTGGGSGGCYSETLSSAELYDPSSGTFVSAGSMTRKRISHTATLLNDGTVLIAGGAAYHPYTTTQSAELFRPAAPRAPEPRSRGIRR